MPTSPPAIPPTKKKDVSFREFGKWKHAPAIAAVLLRKWTSAEENFLTNRPTHDCPPRELLVLAGRLVLVGMLPPAGLPAVEEGEVLLRQVVSVEGPIL